MQLPLVTALVLATLAAPAPAAAAASWVGDTGRPGDFPLVQNAQAATVVVAPGDADCVRLAADLFAEDVERVTGVRPGRQDTDTAPAGPVVLIGTLGQSPLVDRLAASGQLDVHEISGQWESFVISVVDGALVVAGSDRRGTAFGALEVSRAIGVSPWYWWADVAPDHHDSLFVAAGARRSGPPSVQYRGIFLNDEDWGLQPWAAKTFEPEAGNLGPKTYARICELLLRLKANTLWPAMHACSTPFNANPENARVADRYGIVMGSSHCEPLLRNNVGEWPADRAADYNFLTNPAGVTKYWEERLQANGKYENLYTIGMRGIHDGPMQGPQGDQQIEETLAAVFTAQRDLLAKHVNPDPAKVPQIFCPYKEVLGYFLNGLPVPPDVTVVFPDDNFGYLRYLPTAAQLAARPGGFGAYYHISYLGAPLSYVWLNTTPPALIWEEMTKGYDHGLRKFWMLNVGDLKPGEIGIDFFLQLAWNEGRWNLDNLPEYLRSFAAEQFGPDLAPRIARILAEYYRLGFQRKPEHLQWYLGREQPRGSDLAESDQDDEGGERLARYRTLVAQARALERQLPPELRDAYYELVEYPVIGSAAANTRLIAGEKAALALRRNPADVAPWVARFDAATAELVASARRYNEELAGGKWRGIMEDDPLLENRSYRNAVLDLSPEIRAAAAEAPASAPADPPIGRRSRPLPTTEQFAGRFIESNGVVSILAQHYSRKTDRPGAAWQAIPGLGRTGDAVAVFPTTAPSVDLSAVASAAPSLEYDLFLFYSGAASIRFNLVPTQPLVYGQPLRFAVAIDDGAPQLVSIAAGTGDESGVSRAWKENVLDNTTAVSVPHHFATGGPHTLKVYMIDPGVLLEKIVIDQGGLRPSYLGPPETLAAAPP